MHFCNSGHARDPGFADASFSNYIFTSHELMAMLVRRSVVSALPALAGAPGEL